LTVVASTVARSCDAGDADQDAFGVREVTDDEATR
jgi:hypothetical protein